MNWRVYFAIFMFSGLVFAGFQAGKKSVVPAPIMRIPASEANTAFGWPNNCTGKAYCITVFVAPWCPVCKNSATTFKMLQTYLAANRSDIGFGLVMTSGNPEQRRAESQLLAPIEITMDESSLIAKNRRIKAYPTWIINDGAGMEVHNSEGGRFVTSPAMIPKLLAELGL